MSNVATIEKPADQPATANPITPAEMLNSAIARGASIEVIEKLVAMHERMEQSAARRAFDAAIAEAKAEIEPVAKNREGHQNKRYADLAAIARAVDPILARHGLSYRWRSSQSDRISVTCILSHKAGHSEETSLVGPPDQSGSKNVIQAIGSTLTYLQRYTLVELLGLATAEDDDGRAAGMGDKISDEQRERLDKLIDEVGADADKFLAYLKVDFLADLPARQFDRAVSALEAKRVKK